MQRPTIWRAATFAGCQSASFAPRSTSSIALAIEFERNSQLYQRFPFPLPRNELSRICRWISDSLRQVVLTPALTLRP